MNKILFFKPFDYYYFNATIRNYINIIENMENVEVVNCNNYNQFSFEHNSIIIFLPFTLFGIDKNHFNNVKNRIRKAYYAPEFNNINFETANSYYNFFYKMHLNACQTIAILTEYDPHALMEDKLITNYINRDSDFFLLSGTELYDTNFHKEQSPDIDMDKFYEAFIFFKKNSNRLISLSHFIDLSEFSPIDNLYNSKSRIRSAPGARYLNRRLFHFNYVSKNILDLLKTKFDFIFLKIIWQIPNPKIKIHLSKIYFDNIIKNSIYTYTCGSTSGFFIRKFLEIPVYNSCLVTHNYSFLNALGFVENKHYIIPSNMLEYKSTNEFNLRNINYVEVYKIILNARKLIFEKHSIISHQKYIKKTFDKILNNSFKGSYWENGEYKFH